MNGNNEFVIKTPSMQVVEQRLGRPLDEILREMYVERGLTQVQIAEELRVEQAQVSRWMRHLGIKTRRIQRLQEVAASTPEAVA